jgi:hypothetical protein
MTTKKPLALLTLAAASLLTLGCVERKITINSDPSGALVYLNDVEIGRTPVTVPFQWYGDYDVRLTYERNIGTDDKPVMQRYYLHTHRQAKAPPFEWLGIDLFAEILPIPFKDDKVWTFHVPEVVEPTAEELIERAHALKGRLGERVRLADKPFRPVTRPETAPAPTTQTTQPDTQPK